MEGSSSRRARTVATQPQPPMKIDAPRNRTMSENVGPGKMSRVSRLRTTSAPEKTGLGAIPQSSNFETTQQSPKPEAAPPRLRVEVYQQRSTAAVAPPIQVYDPPPSTSALPRGFWFQTLIHVGQHRNLKNSFVDYFNLVVFQTVARVSQL